MSVVHQVTQCYWRFTTPLPRAFVRGGFLPEGAMGLLSTGLSTPFPIHVALNSWHTPQKRSTQGWKKSGRREDSRATFWDFLFPLLLRRDKSAGRGGAEPYILLPSTSHHYQVHECFIWDLKGNLTLMLWQLLCISQAGYLAEAVRTPEGSFPAWWLLLIHKHFH